MQGDPEQPSAFPPETSGGFILHTVRHGFWMEFEPLALQELFCVANVHHNDTKTPISEG